jgi:hypothetical protein
MLVLGAFPQTVLGILLLPCYGIIAMIKITEVLV